MNKNLIKSNILKMQLINARKAKHLTQSDISKKSGLSLTSVHNIESFDTNVTMDSIQRYADAVGAKIILMIKDDENESI